MQNNLIEIKNLIYIVRGQKVMLDSDLAKLYEVETKVLNQAVKRNIERFPQDFMFQLTKEELELLRCQIITTNSKDKHEILRSQIVTTKTKDETRGGRQYLPYAFTEQGVAMLSSVLRSKKAIGINVQIMRTFVKMRAIAIEYKDLQEQITELKKYFIQYAQDNNEEIDRINEAINLLMDRTKPTKIGF